MDFHLFFCLVALTRKIKFADFLHHCRNSSLLLTLLIAAFLKGHLWALFFIALWFFWWGAVKRCLG